MIESNDIRFRKILSNHKKQMKNCESKSNITRFGIICQSPVLKAWEASCINYALDIKNVKLSLIISPTSDEKIKKRGVFTHLMPPEGFSKMFFHLYENYFFRPKCNLSLDFSEKFKRVPSLYCKAIIQNGSEYFREEDIQKIKETNLDFILLFSGFVDLKGEILKASRYGIWLFKQGDLQNYRGNPPGFWEIYYDKSVTGTTLCQLSENQNENNILKKAYFRTKKHSFVQNFNDIHFESARFLKDICTELSNDGIILNNHLTVTKTTQNASADLKPNNTEFIKFLIKLIKNKFSKSFKNLLIVEQWNIGYIEYSVKDLIEKNDELDIHWLLLPSRKGYYADPFAIKKGNSLYILFENYVFRANKAYISSIPFESSVSNLNIKISLKKPHHLSYPFLFKHEDNIYMIPGDWESNKVTLYEAKNFPTLWQKKAVLLEGIQAVDPTLVKYSDLWWLFCTIKSEGPDLRLFIYYSKDLQGPWMPHKKNPVKTDIRSARPAGNIFEYQGSLIRPSQDSSKTYGGRIVLNKICELTPFEFKERPIKFIEANQKSTFNKGLHTLSLSDKIIFLDGKRRIISFYNIGNAIHKKLKSNDSKSRNCKKLRFVDMPKYIEKSEYLNAIDKTVELLKAQKGVRSIYQIGNMNHPGISDIDIFVVFEDNIKNFFDPRLQFKGLLNYLYTHNLSAICESHLDGINKYSFFHNITHLWGKEFSLSTTNMKRSEIKALKIQIALEYLIANFIGLSIQIKYKVIKLRTFLQHVKAIRYDLEFLEITTGEFYDMVHNLCSWLDNWFEQPINLEEYIKWINKFHFELQAFLDEQTFENSFYIPKDAKLKYARNVRIESGESFGYRFKGFWLPKSLSSINKKTFNLNNRLNTFVFNIPYSTTPNDKILDARIKYYEEIVGHVSRFLPYFDPLISGIVLKII